MNEADRVVHERVRQEELIKATADRKLLQDRNARLRSLIQVEIGPALARLKAKSYIGAEIDVGPRRISDFFMERHVAWKISGYRPDTQDIYFTSNGDFVYSHRSCTNYHKDSQAYSWFNFPSDDLEIVLSGLKSL